MRRVHFALAVILFFSPILHSATSFVVPTTTLAAQTANNTSAASTFTSQSNGNLGAINISKVDVHSLLYQGATTKVYAHLMLWFGPPNHMNVGYSSTDPVQVHNQIADMISRGINGVVIDWYGPGNSIDQATKLVMAEAEKHPGFTFAIMVDQGAIQYDSCSGCTPQQTLISQMQYVEQTYFPSPAYMTIQGQPVVSNFDIDLSYTVDWNAVNAALSTHPLFLFQNNSGFTHTLSGGSFSWVMPTTTDYGMSYLSSFYNTGLTVPAEQTMGATYKGFNDTLAPWGSNRIMGQQCGQTWLQTFSEINNLYNSGTQLTDLQLVTWNDYEEGSEIESGIDNCVTLAAAVAGSALQWAIQGNENTVDHYAAYISLDGQNLMPLTDIAAGTHALDLCSFSIPTGKYELFVQAVGKPTLANQITAAINYTPACGSGITPPPPPTLSLSFSASPSAVSIPAGQSGSLTVTAVAQSGSLNTPIALSCAGLPSTLSCSFSPATVVPGSGSATSVLTISTAAVKGRNSEISHRKSAPIYLGWLLPIGFAGFVFAGSVPRKRRLHTLLLFAILALGMTCISCGGGTVAAQNTTLPVTVVPIVPVPSNYSVTVQGTYSSSQLSTTVDVTVQ
jgi:hypothetical protein